MNILCSVIISVFAFKKHTSIYTILHFRYCTIYYRCSFSSLFCLIQDGSWCITDHSRFIWSTCVSSALIAFLYLMITRLQHYYLFTKTVNVDVTYKEDLPFPAVTVCNQNTFRYNQDVSSWNIILFGILFLLSIRWQEMLL